MNLIEQMFKLQNELNNHTNGEMWVDGLTKENRQISWYRCIYMEAAEAIDSFNWKHWKNINVEPDWANIKVELVDIWHFIMSEAIRVDDQSYANQYEEIDAIEDLDSEVLLQTLERILALSAQAKIENNGNVIRETIDLFFVALSGIGMDTKELYKRYVVKNQLNTFRQQNGYKDGSYIKIWGSVEDNVVAFNIMGDNPGISPKDLYQQLESAYASLN
ncbi:MAG TPA: dUTPase [Candidatus Thioglobus sp.]|nr:dUTPase [Candidatus Thioglobus sp.]HIL21379.1 dUTPase [Candidatus Thioglobus sp.]